MLRCWRSTVRLGVPSFLGITTMRAHHLVGTTCGTGSMVPSCTSRSRSDLTADFQWWGTGMGVWKTLPWASGQKWAFRGWPVISGRVWCSQVLKAEEAKWDKSHCSNLTRFSLVGGYGSSCGISGESCRKGQPRGDARLLYGDPVGGRGSSMWETWEVSWDVSQNGYEGGIILRSICAFPDR